MDDYPVDSQAESGSPRPSGDSVGSNSRGPAANSGNRPTPESDEKTIISRSPPDAIPPLSRTGVQGLGRILVGEQLGHYMLEEFVGGGGMGAVFRATDIELGRSVALKVVSGVHNDDDTLRRFKNEAQSAARLDHHNIARVYYVGEDKGWHYIVFEFIHGVNIRDLVDHRGPLPLDEAVYYTLQVAEALEHASQRDVVHRDIKPSNVLVMQDGKVKLVDMGLARLHQVESAADELTASGVTLGTFDYISPEQARDPRSADVRSDLYSLGCTLFYMLTGRPPFPEGTVLQKLFSHSLDAPPDPRDVRPDIPGEVTEIVHKLLAKNPQERYQTPSELIQRLLRLADELPLSLAGRPTAAYEKPAPSRLSRFEYHLPWLVPTALLVLVALLLESISTQETFRVTPPNLPPRQVSAIPPTIRETPSGERTRLPEPDDVELEFPDRSPLDAETDDSEGEIRSAERSVPTESRPLLGEATDEAGGSIATSLPIIPTPELSSLPTGSDRWGALFGPDATGFHVQPPVVGAELSGPGDLANAVPGITRSTTDDGKEEEGTTVTEPETITTPRRVVVGLDIEDPPADALVASSLATAVQKAAEHPSVTTIELRFNDEMLESPFQIVAKSPLLIRGAPGYRPVIRFQPDLGGYGTTRRMLELSGSETVWQDVHFRLQLPTEPSEGWALFGLRGIEELEFIRCTMTLQNMDENGIEWPSGAVFFHFDAPQVSSRMDMGMDMDDMDPGMNPMPSPREPPTLQLIDCAIRGQASFVRSDIAFPLNIIWRQGLLACNERFFQLGGAADASAWDAQIRIELENVTAIVEEGFGLMTLDGRGPLLIDLEMILHDCIVAMNHDAPFLEHRGTGSPDRVERSVIFRGARNAYPVRNPPMTPFLPRSSNRVRWRIVTSGGDRFEFLFGENDRDWYQEELARETVQWRTPLPPGVPFHRYSTEGYEIVPQISTNGPGVGFAPDAIPTFPDSAATIPPWPLEDRTLTLP
jgi:eukaryotic-like serine/threonine-protein kinase